MNKIFKKIKFPQKKSFSEMKSFLKRRNINIEKNFKFVTSDKVIKENKVYEPEIEKNTNSHIFDNLNFLKVIKFLVMIQVYLFRLKRFALFTVRVRNT